MRAEISSYYLSAAKEESIASYVLVPVGGAVFPVASGMSRLTSLHPLSLDRYALVAGSSGIALGLAVLAAAWWAAFRAGDRPLRQLRLTPAGLVVWPMHGWSPISIAWAAVETLVLAQRGDLIKPATTLRIGLSGHRWLMVSGDMPGFEDLVIDLRHLASHATFRQETVRGVIWRQHIVTGVVVALSVYIVVLLAQGPGDAPLLVKIGLLFTMLSTIASSGWDYLRPHPSRSTR
jgi:hypothetical protein